MRDMENYIKGGCDPFSYKPSWAKRVDRYTAQDIKRLNKLFNRKDNRVAMVSYRDFVDIDEAKNGNRVIKDKDFFEHMQKTFGEDTEEILSGLRLRKEIGGEVKYGRQFLKMNTFNNALGRAQYRYPDFADRNDIVIIFNTNDITPFEEALTIYHEICHGLQEHMKCFEREGTLSKKNIDKIKKEDKPEELIKERLLQESAYFSYFKEAHANSFPLAIMMLKAKNDEEREKIVRSYEKHAVSKTINACGGGLSKARYNYWRMFKRIKADLFDENERIRYFDENGRISFEAVCHYTGNIVKVNAYTKEEFLAYSRNDNIGKKTRWIDDVKETKNIEQEIRKTYTRRDYLLDKFLCIRGARSKEQAYQVLDGGRNKENLTSLKKLFLEHNHLPPVHAGFYQKKSRYHQ